MPKYLTAAAAAVGLYVAVGSGKVLTGVLPAGLAVLTALVDYALWERRRRPWHDWTVIGLLLPAIGAAVWLALGGLATGTDRGDDARPLAEVGPGVALTGLLCTLISYHGRHPHESG